MKPKINIPQIKAVPHSVSIGNYSPKQIVELSDDKGNNFSLEFPKKFFLWNTRKIKGIYKLEIIDLDLDGLCLVSSPENSLISIRTQGKQGPSINVEPFGHKLDFSLILNPSLIVDYNDNLSNIINLQEPCAHVKFKIRLSETSNEGKISSAGESIFIVSEEVVVPIKIERPNPKLMVELSDLNNKLEYEVDSVEHRQIGTLLLEHSMHSSCSPEIQANFMVNLKDGDEEIRRCLNFGETVTESNPASATGDITIRGVDGSSPLLYKKDGLQYALSHIKACNPSNKIQIPLLLDMSKLSNPNEDEKRYEIEIRGSYSYFLEGKRIEESLCCRKELIIKKNSKLNALKVSCLSRYHRDLEYILSTKDKYPWGKLLLTPDFSNVCTLKIGNEATVINPNSPEASVVVWNFKVKSLMCESSRFTLKDGLTPEKYFILQNRENSVVDIYNDNTILQFFPTQVDGTLNSISLDLKIHSNDVIKIDKDRNGSFLAPVSLEFEFDYAEVESGVYKTIDSVSLIPNTERKHFEGGILWTIEQAANPQWLSVDMGTSAIVASYASEFDVKESPLINLRANKDLLLSRAYRGKDEKRKDETKESAPFIPSLISFNSISNSTAVNFDEDMEDENFSKYSIWLSPSTGMKDIILPCLKTLVGYKTIPNILTERERQEFKYRVDGIETTLFDQDGKVIEKGLAYVNIILEEVYKQLFRHYICIDARDASMQNPVRSNDLHKMVMSVPNTFTPKHHQLLKNIAKKIFPSLRPEYLQIVSESDAVACYYIQNRSYFFEKTSELIKSRKEKLDQKEHVLVFDMGAGTLDLTYFIHQRTPEGVLKIDIKGKIGVNKAGNYLDYVLGEIIADLLKGTPNHSKIANLLEYDKNKRISAGISKVSCEKFKDYLKDEIKPLLNIGNRENVELPDFDKSYPMEVKGRRLSIRDISEHRLYKNYIVDCTENVIDSLKSLLSSNAENRIGFGTAGLNSLPLDVVVFSGRSTTLLDIRKGVIDCIRRTFDRPDEVLCADLVSETIMPINSLMSEEVNSILLPQRNDSSKKLKSVVSCGSLIYADLINRPAYFKFVGSKIFANYGLLVKDVTDYGYYGGWKWYPLITKESNERPQPRNIYQEYIMFEENQKISLDRNSKIIFIQSYSKNPAEDWNIGNKDMIAEITHFNIPNGAVGFAEVCMTISNLNTITCSIEGFGEISMDPHDDFNNESLRKSLWPVAF